MLTIRYEKMGMLLYSDKKKNYFFTDDKIIIEECKRLFSYGKNTNINHNLLLELEELGYQDGIRELTTTSDYLMAPLEYYFDFTSLCNLKCEHCYNKENISSTTMNDDKIKAIIKDMYENGIMRIHLAGGEPTRVPEGLDTYMSTAKKYGIVSSMSTNGVDINSEIFEIMFKNDLFSITVSLEGATEQKNAIIRGEGNFEKALATIRKLVKLKKEKNNNTIICLKTSYDTNIAKEDLEDIIKLGISLGVDVVKLANPERCIFHEIGFYGNIYDNYYKVLFYVAELKEKYKEQIYISNIANPLNKCGQVGLPNMKGCIGAQELIAINPDGRISPCLMNQINLGNIFDYKSINDFWNNSEKLREYRKTIANYKCQKCSLHSSCRGGCQVRKFVEYGEIKDIDPLCPMKNSNINLNIEKEENIDNKKILKKINTLHSL